MAINSGYKICMLGLKQSNGHRPILCQEYGEGKQFTHATGGTTNGVLVIRNIPQIAQTNLGTVSGDFNSGNVVMDSSRPWNQICVRHNQGETYCLENMQWHDKGNKTKDSFAQMMDTNTSLIYGVYPSLRQDKTIAHA